MRFRQRTYTRKLCPRVQPRPTQVIHRIIARIFGGDRADQSRIHSIALLDFCIRVFGAEGLTRATHGVCHGCGTPPALVGAALWASKLALAACKCFRSKSPPPGKLTDVVSSMWGTA